MPDLHIVVCMKVVPKPEEIRVDPETHWLDREGARSEFNPPDMNALEVALVLKDRHGGRVTLLSMGPPFFEPYLRIGLAMGADDAILLSDRAFAGADTLATTYTLAKGIEKITSVDLILCGEESSDGATGQVPPGLAEWMNLPQITMVTSVEVDLARRIVRGRREVMGGYEILESSLPALLSVKTAANEPRFMDYEIKEWAMNQAKIPSCDSESLETDPDYIGSPGSPTIVTGLDQAESRDRKREFLKGTPEEIADKLVRIIRAAL